MNIFYLDENMATCARYHCDAHVVKMILESVQILCTVLSMNHIVSPYRPTHQQHPCVLWANKSLSNWILLRQLAEELNQEFRYRFNHLKNHKSYDVITRIPLPPIHDLGLTEIPQVMPDEYKQDNPVLAYRHYFTACKSHLAKWTKRGAPYWFTSGSI